MKFRRNSNIKQTKGRHEQRYGFMPRKSTTDAGFALRLLLEKCRGQRELHCGLVDFKKAFDKLPREEPWPYMRKSGTARSGLGCSKDI